MCNGCAWASPETCRACGCRDKQSDGAITMTKTITREEFYKAYESHLGDKSTKINFRNGYEIHYPNGDVYKYVETLKPDRTPSSWSGTYMASDFTYACYWNGMLIVK